MKKVNFLFLALLMLGIMSCENKSARTIKKGNRDSLVGMTIDNVGTYSFPRDRTMETNDSIYCLDFGPKYNLNDIIIGTYTIKEVTAIDDLIDINDTVFVVNKWTSTVIDYQPFSVFDIKMNENERTRNE